MSAGPGEPEGAQLRALWLAQGGEFVPPGAGDFNLPPIFAGITKPMVLAVLSIIIVMVFFMMASRRLKIVPTRFTFIAESVYNFGRNNLARELIGSKEFMPYVPLIVTLFSFVLVNNIFGIIPIIQFPTMSHIGFPIALSALIIYPLWNYVGIRKHGLLGHFKHQLVPAGVPKPILLLYVPIEIFVKFFMNPITHAIRVFAAMFAGHLILLVFTLAGEYLLLEASGVIKPVSLVSWAFAILMTFLEALIMVLQAYIFALLAANYIGGALAEDH
jgi:F-type H+-transporting ATPase subunit a